MTNAIHKRKAPQISQTTALKQTLCSSQATVKMSLSQSNRTQNTLLDGIKSGSSGKDDVPIRLFLAYIDSFQLLEDKDSVEFGRSLLPVVTGKQFLRTNPVPCLQYSLQCL